MAATLPMPDDERREDDIVVLHTVTWADFQRLLEVRGDRGAPRFHYLKGALEIMSPSRHHEAIKSLIGRLVEAYCLEQGIEFSTFGSWTLQDEAVERGAEPDECYVFGLERPGDDGRPDLAIEVEWSKGGLNKLDIYSKLGVREVWIWRRGVLTPFVLRDGEYTESIVSGVLPGLDLGLLASFLDDRPTSVAIRGYRAALGG